MTAKYPWDFERFVSQSRFGGPRSRPPPEAGLLQADTRTASLTYYFPTDVHGRFWATQGDFKEVKAVPPSVVGVTKSHQKSRSVSIYTYDLDRTNNIIEFAFRSLTDVDRRLMTEMLEANDVTTIKTIEMITFQMPKSEYGWDKRFLGRTQKPNGPSTSDSITFTAHFVESENSEMDDEW